MTAALWSINTFLIADALALAVAIAVSYLATAKW